MTLCVDIGVFAHNEAAGIAAMMARLAEQDILCTEGISARMLLLANGCTDDTVALALRTAAPGVVVIDLPEPGKSRTWNRFTHDLSRPEADVLLFVDADIRFCGPDALRRLAQGLAARSDLWALNSQPVKDIVVDPGGRSTIEKVIAAAGGGLDDWTTAICGQLYAMPAAIARRFQLPQGLPVEDGLLRALVLTDAFSDPERFDRIDGLRGLWHVYASERNIAALIRHQTRIVIGSAINFACFEWLASLPVGTSHAELAKAAGEADFLKDLIRRSLPRWPFGFVPVHFLLKRLTRLRGRDLLRPKHLAIVGLGFGFDLIVYLRAQVAMLRGTGAGFW